MKIRYVLSPGRCSHYEWWSTTSVHTSVSCYDCIFVYTAAERRMGTVLYSFGHRHWRDRAWEMTRVTGH